MSFSFEVNPRFLVDIRHEPKQILEPISGYEQEPLLSLEEACQSLENILGMELNLYITVAKLNSQEPKDGLTQDESASIYLYTMEWNETENSLYAILNQTLRTADRSKLQPWFKYLKLFFTALFKLPFTEYHIIWRGVSDDLSGLYREGDELTWWSLSSGTSSIDVLESPMYFGLRLIGSNLDFAVLFSQNMTRQLLSINDLPIELLSTIFQFVRPLDMLLTASYTCQLWRKIIYNEWFLNKYSTGGISKHQLIGWWKFDDINNIGLDSSGVLGDRYHVFGQPTIEDCFLGKCAVFDGRSFIDLPVNDKSEYQTDVYSVSIWFWADLSAWARDQREGGWRTAVGSWHDWYPTNHAWLHLGFHVDMNISNQVMISAAQYAFNCQDSQKIEPCRWYHVVVR
ncbi:unnamed protein product, partial [Adineta steineri]